MGWIALVVAAIFQWPCDLDTVEAIVWEPNIWMDTFSIIELLRLVNQLIPVVLYEDCC